MTDLSPLDEITTPIERIRRLEDALSAANARADTAEAAVAVLAESLDEARNIFGDMIRTGFIHDETCGVCPGSYFVGSGAREKIMNATLPTSAQRVADVVQAAVPLQKDAAAISEDIAADIQEGNRSEAAREELRRWSNFAGAVAAYVSSKEKPDNA